MDKRTRLYVELLEASKAQIAANRDVHKLQTKRIASAVGKRRNLKAARPQTPVPKVPLDFLAIGNSWFEYPLDGNGPSFDNTAIVAQAQLGSMGSPPPHILNQALHGQATTAMLSYQSQETLISLLQDKEQWLNQDTGLPDGIFVSGGGDDLVGDQLAIYLDYGGGGLNAIRIPRSTQLRSSILHGFICVPGHFRQGRTNHWPLLRLCDPEQCSSNLHSIGLALAVAFICWIRL